MCESDVNLMISFTVRYLINLLIRHFGKVSNVFLPEAIFLTCFKKYSPTGIVMIYKNMIYKIRFKNLQKYFTLKLI